MSDIVFGPDSQNIDIYSGDAFKLNFRVLSPDSNDYINTGSWNFYFFNKDDGSKLYSTPTVISASPMYNQFLNKEYIYTAEAEQTTFTGADDNGSTLAYVAGSIEVYKNDVLVSSDDYTATNGTSVVLDTAPAESDEIKIIAINFISPTGVTEIFVSSSVTALLLSTASTTPIGYEFYIDTNVGKYTFLKGDVDVSSKLEG